MVVEGVGERTEGGLWRQKKSSIHEPCHLWLPRGLGLINDQASWEDVTMHTLSLSPPPSVSTSPTPLLLSRASAVGVTSLNTEASHAVGSSLKSRESLWLSCV